MTSCLVSPDFFTLNMNGATMRAFLDEDISKLQKIIENNAHLIIEFSQQGGFANASGF